MLFPAYGASRRLYSKSPPLYSKPGIHTVKKNPVFPVQLTDFQLIENPQTNVMPHPAHHPLAIPFSPPTGKPKYHSPGWFAFLFLLVELNWIPGYLYIPFSRSLPSAGSIQFEYVEHLYKSVGQLASVPIF